MRKLTLFIALVLVALFAVITPVAAAVDTGPAGIDWSPVTTAIVALIATIITTFIPAAIKLFFEAQSARLAKVKATIEQNQLVVNAIVQVVQQTAGVLEGSQKYQLALGKASEALHLPTNTLHDMIELAVSTAKLSWGAAWDGLGGKTP